MFALGFSRIPEFPKFNLDPEYYSSFTLYRISGSHVISCSV